MGCKNSGATKADGPERVTEKKKKKEGYDRDQEKN